MHLLDYVNEIWDIAVENQVGIDVAKDMFLTNISNIRDGFTTEVSYLGADIDYKVLVPHHDELYNKKVLREYNETVKKFYSEIAQLRKDGKRDAVKYLFTEKDAYIPKVTEQTKI